MALTGRTATSVVWVTDARADRADAGDEWSAGVLRSASVRESADELRRGREHAPNYVASVVAKEGIFRPPRGVIGFAVTSKRSGAVPRYRMGQQVVSVSVASCV